MPMRRFRASRIAAAVGLIAATVATTLTVWALPASALTVGAQPLKGTFKVTPGSCSAIPVEAPSGSYFFMSKAGVTIPNPSSPCAGGLYTPLSPGNQGGLVTGQYQYDPNPTFDARGNSLAGGIVRPVSFELTDFGLATTCADQQHHPSATGACAAGQTGFPAPMIYAEPPGTGGCKLGVPSLGSPTSLISLLASLLKAPSSVTSVTSDCLYGNLLGLGATWNGPGSNCAATGGVGCYDQGAATGPELTATSCDPPAPASACGISGTYDPLTGAYTLEVHATIEGTAFNGAVGNYVLQGDFTTSSAPASTSSSSGSSSTTASSQPSGSSPATAQSPSSGFSSPGSSSASSTAASAPTVEQLDGVFQIASGSCGSGSKPSGSYVFLTKGGGPIPNSSSNCDNGDYTPIEQGTTGLRTGTFQPDPTPTFDSQGNSLATSIMKPTLFEGSDFSIATDSQNEQDNPSGPAVFPPPSVILSGPNQITANLSSLNATYNGTPNSTCATGQPPGDGCYAIGNSAVSGSYNPTTHAYKMDWSASIHGGAFNGAAANFQLTGTFVGTVVTTAAPVGATVSSASSGYGSSGLAGAAAGTGGSYNAAVGSQTGGTNASGAAAGHSAQAGAGQTAKALLASSSTSSGVLPAVETAVVLAVLAALLGEALLSEHQWRRVHSKRTQSRPG